MDSPLDSLPIPETVSAQINPSEQRDFGADRVVSKLPLQSEKSSSRTDGGQSRATGKEVDNDAQISSAGILQNATSDLVANEIALVRSELFTVFPKIALFGSSGAEAGQVAQFSGLVRRMIEVRRQVNQL